MAASSWKVLESTTQELQGPGGAKISQVGEPTNPTDAARKQEVDGVLTANAVKARNLVNYERDLVPFGRFIGPLPALGSVTLLCPEIEEDTVQVLQIDVRLKPTGAAPPQFYRHWLFIYRETGGNMNYAFSSTQYSNIGGAAVLNNPVGGDLANNQNEIQVQSAPSEFTHCEIMVHVMTTGFSS